MMLATPKSARLVAPSAALLAAYVESLRADHGQILGQVALRAMTRILEADVSKAYERFWLICGQNYIGRVSLRFDIGDPSAAMMGHIAYEVLPKFRRQGFGHCALALGLAELRRRGVGEVLILCEDDNIASIRIIEAAGGRLQGRAASGDDPRRRLRRYRIAAPAVTDAGCGSTTAT